MLKYPLFRVFRFFIQSLDPMPKSSVTIFNKLQHTHPLVCYLLTRILSNPVPRHKILVGQILECTMLLPTNSLHIGLPLPISLPTLNPCLFAWLNPAHTSPLSSNTTASEKSSLTTSPTVSLLKYSQWHPMPLIYTGHNYWPLIICFPSRMKDP